jgi:hypothetical protein
MGSSKIFKCGFDITDYKDILPDVDEYLKHDRILNLEEYDKGNIENCFWKKHVPTAAEIASPTFREQEARRILKSGVYACVAEEIVWIPPPLYYNLNYTKVSGVDPEFRLKRVMSCYHRIRARENKHCKGVMILKGRQDGETSYSMSEAFWETFDMEDGQITLNSKTRADAINPCWKTVQSLYMGMPRWIFNMFFGDCETNGKNIAETIKFLRFADESKGVSAKNILMAYYPAVYNALDGKNSVRRAIGDEFLKWIECNFGEWFNNASKFIMPGFQRSGMFDLFSSPPEKDSQSYRDGYELWQKSDTSKMGADGTTESRIHRWYSNPLHGIQGSYDKFGDADPEKIYDWIMKERKRQPKDKLLEEIRGFPLTEEEIWGSLDGGHFWSNHKGLQARQIYLIGKRFKDDKTKEPTVVRGNLEWVDAIPDNPKGVQFRQSDKTTFDVNEARFAFSFLPKNIEPLKDIHRPPQYVEHVIGADPFAKRHPNGKRSSSGAMTIYKFRDVLETGVNKAVCGLYVNRPAHEDIYYEDILKACIFFQAPLQFESNIDKAGNYLTDRGYKDWCLPAIGEIKGSDRLGDHVTSRGKFIDEMVGLMDSFINIPVDNQGRPLEDECLLNNLWIEELVSDLLKFSLKDTHERDASMSFGQSLIGAMKLSFKKQREKSSVNNSVLSYLLG